MKSEIVVDDEILNIVNERETLASEDGTIKDLEKDFPAEIEKLEEALNNYISENDLKFLRTKSPDEWKYLKKLANPYEYFNSFDDYQKPVIM